MALKHRKQEKEKTKEKKDKDEPKNFTSFWSKILPIKFFKSEWSFAQFRIPELKSICAFAEDNRVIGKFQYN